MSEKYKVLLERYPILCQQGDPKWEPFDYSDFAIGDGWFTVVEKMCWNLSKYPVKIVQAKEKFGILRVYIEGLDENNTVPDEAYDAVRVAEQATKHICEYCGGPSKVNGSGWLTTRCEECSKKSHP